MCRWWYGYSGSRKTLLSVSFEFSKRLEITLNKK